MTDSKERKFVICIFIFALTLRILYTLFLRQNYFFYDHPGTDVLFYQNWAKEISRHNGLGSTVFFGMPLYPYALALLDRLTLGHWEIIRFLHLVLGSVNCCAAYFIAKKIFSKKVALVSSLLMAGNFTLIYYDWLTMPATLLITFSCIIIYSLLTLDEKSKTREWFILGLLIGLIILGDGKFLVFFMLMLGHLFFQYRFNFQRFVVKIFTPLFVGVFIILSIVTLRNFLVSRDFVFISAHSGINFYLGNHPQSTGTFSNPAFLRPSHEGHANDSTIIAEESLGHRLLPSEVSDFWRQKALDFIRQHPKQFVFLLKDKLNMFLTENQWTYDIDLLLQNQWQEKLEINRYRVILPLALVGMIFSYRRKKKSRWLDLLIFSQLAFSLLFFVIHRHRVTILPFLMMFECFALFWIFDQFREKAFAKALFVVMATLWLIYVLKPTKVSASTIDFLTASNSGPIHMERNEFQQAQKQYQKALKLNPRDANSLYNLGNCYVAQDKYKEAILTYHEALRIYPLDTNTLYNLAFAYEMIKQYDLSLQAYQSVLRLQSSSPDALYRLAGIYSLRGDCAKAESQYQKLIELKPLLENQITYLIRNCKTK
ncbi:MAG: tetratricopeptide repeat protein [Candidatus Omnitrophota bacterium]